MGGACIQYYHQRRQNTKSSTKATKQNLLCQLGQAKRPLSTSQLCDEKALSTLICLAFFLLKCRLYWMKLASQGDPRCRASSHLCTHGPSKMSTITMSAAACRPVVARVNAVRRYVFQETERAGPSIGSAGAAP